MYDFDKITDRVNTNSCKWDKVREGGLPMWVADMDFEVMPEIKESIMDIAEKGVYGYSTTPDKYFQSIKRWWKVRHDLELDTSWMIYSTGVVASISSIVRKLTTPNENVLITAPVYNIFYNSILNNGRRVLSSDLVYDGEKYELDFDDLEKKLKDPQTSLMILCNPQNPTGKVWTKEEIKRIIDLTQKYGVILISDEIHCDVIEPGMKYTPALIASSDVSNVIMLVAGSKVFNIAGLHSSAAIVKDPVLRHKVWRGINTDECGEPNAFAINANVAAYNNGDKWVDELNAYISENKKYFKEFIKENLPNIRVIDGGASYLLWLDMTYYSKDSSSLVKTIYEKTGLLLNSGSSYGKCGDGFVRINLGTQLSRVKDGCLRLRKALEE